MSRLNRILLLSLLCLWTLPSALWLYLANTIGTMVADGIAAEAHVALTPIPDTPSLQSVSSFEEIAALEQHMNERSLTQRARGNVTLALLPPAIGYALILLLLLTLNSFSRRRS